MARSRTCGDQSDPAIQVTSHNATHGNGPGPTRSARARRFVRAAMREDALGRLRVAMLAPPWIPIPAPGYGGIEAVVEVLCDRLVGVGHDVWMLQSRPVTSTGSGAREIVAEPTGDGAAAARLRRGIGAAPGSGGGPVRVIKTLADAGRLSDGDVLVTHMTSPDWVPLMRRAAAIVTDSGGMTYHAAIVSRELGVPCVVGTGEATRTLRDAELVTVDASHGLIPPGMAPSRNGAVAPAPASLSRAVTPPATGTKLLVNLSEPSHYPEYAELLVRCGIDAISVNMDVVDGTRGLIAAAETRLIIDAARNNRKVTP